LSGVPRFHNETQLLAVALLGAIVYGVMILLLFGRRWLALLRRRGPTGAAGASAPAVDTL
jgi:hypothetical protein